MILSSHCSSSYFSFHLTLALFPPPSTHPLIPFRIPSEFPHLQLSLPPRQPKLYPPTQHHLLTPFPPYPPFSPTLLLPTSPSPLLPPLPARTPHWQILRPLLAGAAAMVASAGAETRTAHPPFPLLRRSSLGRRPAQLLHPPPLVSPPPNSAALAAQRARSEPLGPAGSARQRFIPSHQRPRQQLHMACHMAAIFEGSKSVCSVCAARSRADSRPCALLI